MLVVKWCVIVFVYSKTCMIICAIFCPVWIGSDRISDAAGRFTGGRAPNGSNPGM